MARQPTKRALKYGSNAFVGVLLAVGILVVVNLLGARYRFRIDTTEANTYSLSDQTETLLDSLRQDVHVVAFFRDQDRRQMEDLLRNYAFASRHFTYEIVDPDKNPVRARESGVQTYGTSLVRSGDRLERIRGSDEKELTNAISRAVRTGQRKIYFLAGHGEKRLHDFERGGYSMVLKALWEANYTLHDSLLLPESKGVPADCDLLIVAGPRSPMFPEEADSIGNYLAGGGAGLFLLDPGTVTGLEGVLDRWAIGVNDDYVVDGSGLGRLFGLDYSMPVAASYANHPITVKHKGLMTFYMLARSLSQVRETPGFFFTKLVMTSGGAWRETGGIRTRPTFDPEQDIRGPVCLAVAVKAKPMEPRTRPDGKPQQFTRITVFGDSDFASNQFFPTQGNGDLFMNAVSWLLVERDAISIRPKERAYRPISLRRSDSEWIFWIGLVLLPAAPVAAGLGVWWRRR